MDSPETDRALSRLILKGDEHAFRMLFDRFCPRLYRFALARLDGDRDQACEVVQLTFCKAFERLDSWRGESSLYGWFCQICRNCIADVRRRRQRERPPVAVAEDATTIEAVLESLAAPATDEPESRAWRAELVRLIQAALDCLPGHYGDVLEWKYVDGMSVQEIAARLGIGTKAAESSLTRARDAFREAFAAIAGSTDMLAPSIMEAT